MVDPDIEALGAVLGIPIEAGWVESIRTNLRISLGMGGLVAVFVLEDEVEVAGVFAP